MVLSQGQVIERGPHDHLMALDREYANLIRSI
jgi:ABC-type multidrug transport system fused ATPase/permease subunit